MSKNQINLTQPHHPLTPRVHPTGKRVHKALRGDGSTPSVFGDGPLTARVVGRMTDAEPPIPRTISSSQFVQRCEPCSPIPARQTIAESLKYWRSFIWNRGISSQNAGQKELPAKRAHIDRIRRSPWGPRVVLLLFRYCSPGPPQT